MTYLSAFFIYFILCLFFVGLVAFSLVSYKRERSTKFLEYLKNLADQKASKYSEYFLDIPEGLSKVERDGIVNHIVNKGYMVDLREDSAGSVLIRASSLWY